MACQWSTGWYCYTSYSDIPLLFSALIVMLRIMKVVIYKFLHEQRLGQSCQIGNQRQHHQQIKHSTVQLAHVWSLRNTDCYWQHRRFFLALQSTADPLRTKNYQPASKRFHEHQSFLSLLTKYPYQLYQITHEVKEYINAVNLIMK